jgi:hypothetical protein
MYQELDTKIVNENNQFLNILIENNLINLAVKYQKFDEKILNLLILDHHIDDDFWNLISQHQQLSSDFIKSHDDNLNWTLISIYQDLNMEIIAEYLDKIDWNNIPLNIRSGLLINDNTIKLYEKYPIWDNIAFLKNVSTIKLFNYIDKINISCINTILKFRFLSEEQINIIITKYKEDPSIWLNICENQRLTNEIIDKYKDKICWPEISEHHDFTVNDLIKYDKHIDYKKLSYNDNFNDDWINCLLELKKTNNNVNLLDMEYLLKYELIDKPLF